MKKYNNLLTRIADEYSIQKGLEEDEQQWKTRIIYSHVGRMALASLWDTYDEDAPTIVHMKKRIVDVLSSFCEIYPEIESFFPQERTELSDAIYSVYDNSGVIYHRPNHIQMSQKSRSNVAGVVFTRGYALEENQLVSGLGTYMLANEAPMPSSVIRMFQLEVETLTKLWNNCISVSQWVPFFNDVPAEYLRLSPPFSKGYWSGKPHNGSNISILRTGCKGVRQYYLYKSESNQIYVSQLPQWQVEGCNYRSLANACLAQNKTLPATKFSYDGDIVNIKFEYLPPPAELNFMKLYSWPQTYASFPQDFRRVFQRRIFDAIKEVLEPNGYKYIEE